MAHTGSQQSHRVLIVDDNLALAENVAEILQMDGYVTDVVGSAEEALVHVAATLPDVLVTDYRLPGANGANLVRQLRAMGMRVRAVVISAYTDQVTIGDAESAGAAFVSKPVNFEILGQVIRDRVVA